ncbi:LEAFY-like protein [Tripterygium wilfordii]|uniref:Floricaula/leafy-like transcription factor n=1 Tax=Tripterygium wilfordii TaxID=458696 RepID=A0A7J7CDQ5_TRIWF|nr:floricaula/leafy homolog isoform X2 [Tripterygium wilfordii]KAF5732253.1 LEAFY-like protein [Tripterygium wilfordii]
MDPEAFTASLFKWDPRGVVQPVNRLMEAVAPPPALQVATEYGVRSWELGGLEDLFQAYGVRHYTAAKIAELGFTVSTLLNMRDEELDEMMNSLSHIARWDLLVGERYGIKAAVRAERRILYEEDCRRRHLLTSNITNNLDALSQEGLSEETVQQDKEAARRGGVWTWEMAVAVGEGKKQLRRRKGQKKVVNVDDDNDEDNENSVLSERQREHPFIVTEPGEVARGKKNGLDYLFHLYEQCRDFLIQVQNIAKDRGEKCPTKVTNEVFRYANKAGANYINKPKMRHYVHCYALHCLDKEASNALRREFKERGENVGAWRQACYNPLVGIAATQGWDIDALFNGHPRLSIWYVPTKLRQLCHAERNCASASTSIYGGGDPLQHY